MSFESPDPHPAPTRLAVLEGSRAGEEIEVFEDAVIGRTHADIIISDPEMSRQHAFIRPVPGGVELEDLGSLNGTFVDEQRIAQTTTAPSGAKIRMGTTVVEVIAEVSPEVAAAQKTTAVRKVPPGVYSGSGEGGPAPQ